MPTAKIKDRYLLIEDIYNRCKSIFGIELTSKLIFKERDNFPLSICGKRNNIALTEEQIPDNSIMIIPNKKETVKRKIKKL